MHFSHKIVKDAKIASVFMFEIIQIVRGLTNVLKTA